MTRINYVLLGSGNIAQAHIEALSTIKNASLIGIYSRDYKRAEKIAQKYKIRPYRSLDDVLKDSNVHAVDIITINSLHKEYAIRSAQYKKHVIVEKPLAPTTKDAQEIVDACNQNKVKLSVISNYRTSHFFQSLKKKIAKGELGEVNLVNATIKLSRSQEYFQEHAGWRSKFEEVGGGVVLMNAIHLLDLFLHLFGDVEAVRLICDKQLLEDTAAITLKFKKGPVCSILATRKANASYPDIIEIYGTKGSLGLSEKSLKFYITSSHKPLSALFSKLRKMQIPHMGGIKQQLEDFSSAILENKDPIVTGEEGVRALKVIERLYASAKKGRKEQAIFSQ